MLGCGKRGTAIIHIGTSGWSYDHWKEIFYPKEVKSPERLHFFGGHFDTVEVNSTFYHNPSESTIKNWVKQVPKNFVFSVKANGYITHRKRLKDFEQSTVLFFEKVKLFGTKLGPILFQLPPSFKEDRERLEAFTSYLPMKYSYVFEFRHDSWFNEDVYKILRQRNISLCLTDIWGKLTPEVETADFMYVRLHGPKKAYQGKYSKKEIEEWQKRILRWQKENLDAYCYFDNDEKAYAVHDAKRLCGLISEPER